MNKKEAIVTINEKAKKQEPFFFMIDYGMNHTILLSPKDASDQGILFQFPTANNIVEPFVSTTTKALSFDKKPIDFIHYAAAFNKVQDHLHKGNSYLVNLTFPSAIETNYSLDELFVHAMAKYKILYRNHFVVFSPESFIRIEKGLISTYPMKGTIDARLPSAQQRLLENVKEFAEHATIVDLLRNDLSLFASNVHVENFRYIETIESNEKELLQVSSKITGMLPPDYTSFLGDLIFGLLPAGSVTGAPKAKTLEIIAEAENYDRGFYTGIAGWFDGRNLDSCVLIRFVEKVNGKYFYKSGGGITFQSNVKEEYQELIDKIYVPVGRSNKS